MLHLVSHLLIELSLLTLHLFAQMIYFPPKSKILMDAIGVVVTVRITEPVVRCFGRLYECCKNQHFTYATRTPRGFLSYVCLHRASLGEPFLESVD